MQPQLQKPDQWYATTAVQMFRSAGWTGKVRTVKLVHPDGRDRFDTSGAVFIYGYPNERSYFSYLCALFPNQTLKMHHHEERVEVFSVLWGTVYQVTVSGAIPMKVGDFLTSRIGEKHGLSTDAQGGLLVGVCHVNHLCDTYWEQDPLSCITDGILGTINDDKTYTNIIPFEPFSHFDQTLHNTMNMYKDMNRRAHKNDELTALQRTLDEEIPLYMIVDGGDCGEKKVVDVKITEKAAFAGRLDFLKWCMETYGKHVFNDRSLTYAIKGRHKEVAQWLLDEGLSILDISLIKEANSLGIKQRAFIMS
jgi:mannose-6-phosphate isomerase-like protein (cupin superfamily)